MCTSCLSVWNSNRTIIKQTTLKASKWKRKMCQLLYIHTFAVCVSCRRRTGGHTSSAMVSISDSTTLKVRAYLCVFNLCFSWRMSCLWHVVLLSSDTEIKGDILFLGYYESEFDWSNETAKVKLPQFCNTSCFFYIDIANSPYNWLSSTYFIHDSKQEPSVSLYATDEKREALWFLLYIEYIHILPFQSLESPVILIFFFFPSIIA